jgi:hypothetical protein
MMNIGTHWTAAREYRLKTSQLHITRSLFTALLYYTYKDI